MSYDPLDVIFGDLDNYDFIAPLRRRRRTTPQEDFMPTPAARKRSINALRKQLATIAAEIDKLESRPDEPEHGTVIKFNLTFGGPSSYTYAAIHAGGYWYTTGSGPDKVTWDKLLDWMYDGEATGFETMTPDPLFTEMR